VQNRTADRSFESRVWQRALDRGLLSTGQVNECLKESGQDAPTLRLTEVLVAKGVLRADQVRDLRGDVVRTGPETPREVLDAAVNSKNLVGRYVLVDELGRGGMGVVHRAWDGDLRRFVALKMLTGLWNDEDLARFRREAQSAAALRHPNIITVYEIGDSDETPFIALELIEGRTLHGRKLPTKKAAELMIAVALAVEAAHRKGIIHRDLKPANVMVDAGDVPRVMDFGLAKPIESSSQITVSGTVMGTPAYMSPEQARGEKIDRRSDLFSLGAMMYELLTGRPAFGGTTPLETLTAVVRHDPVPPRKLAPHVPRPLEAVILTCLQKDKARRYPSAEALARDLERFLRGEPVMARLPASPHRLLFAVSAGIVLAAGLAAMIWSPAPAPPPPLPAPLPARPAPVDRGALDEGLRLVEVARLDLFRPNADLEQTRLTLEKAEARFNEVIQRDPSSGAALLARGTVRERLHRTDEALADFDQAIEKMPSSPTAVLSHGRLLLERYLDEMVVAAWQESLIPEELRQWRRRATEDFLKARALGASEGDLPYLEAVLAFTEEKHERAIERIAQALPTASHPEEFLKLRGDVRMVQAQRLPDLNAQGVLVRDAIQDYTEALKLRANYLGALRMRGGANWYSRRPDLAFADFQTILQFHPRDSQALSDMGTYHTRSGRPEEALDYFERALAVDPRNFRAYSNRASVHLSQSHPEKAKVDAEQALKIRPHYLAAMNNLAAACYMLGDKAEALRRFDEILVQSPLLTKARSSRGVVHYESGHWKEALQDLERSVAEDPGLEPRFAGWIRDCRQRLSR
jgi:eukaryotic-like serine/threonine-protein kinase